MSPIRAGRGCRTWTDKALLESNIELLSWIKVGVLVCIDVVRMQGLLALVAEDELSTTKDLRRCAYPQFMPKSSKILF